MANIDAPFGFTPNFTRTSTIPRVRLLSDGSAAIGRGDPLKPDGSGRYLSITGVGDNPTHVAASSAVNTAGVEVFAYRISDIDEWLCQVDDATLTDNTNNGNFFDLTVTTLNTTTLKSTMELDGDASAQDTLELVGRLNKPGNAWGLNVIVIVRFRVSANAIVIATT